MSLNRDILILIATAITLRGLYFIIAFFYQSEPADLSIFKRNDSYWYETIAVDGHSKIEPDQLGSCTDSSIEQSYYAFFPLYPFTVGAIIQGTGADFNVAAFLLSFVLVLLLIESMYRVVLNEIDSKATAFWSTLLLLLFPFHYYFSMFYTECLFLVLLLNAWWAIRNERKILMALFLSGLVLVRPNGLFILLPLWILQNNDLISQTLNTRKIPIREFFERSLIFVVPVLVFIGYCGYLFQMTGDFFAYKTAQAGWCRETVLPWVPILLAKTAVDYFQLAYFLGFSVLWVRKIRSLPLSHNVLIAIGMFLPLMANSIPSPRFISTIFLFFILIGQFISVKSSFNKAVVISLLVVAHVWSFLFWLDSDLLSF